MEDATAFQKLVEKLLLVIPASAAHPEIVGQDIAKQLFGKVRPDEIDTVSGDAKAFFHEGLTENGALDYTRVSIGDYQTSIPEKFVSVPVEINARGKSYQQAYLRATLMLCEKGYEALYNKIVIRLVDGREIPHYFMVGVALPSASSE